MANVHFPQAGKIAGGPSEYTGSPEFEDRCYGYYAGSVIQHPNDTTSPRMGRNYLPIRETNGTSGPKTGSFLIPRSTVSR